MQSVSIAQPAKSSEADIRLAYVWLIAFVAAFGGFLFGYDWVVIGGAKPFYEAYFHLHSPQAIAWANSSALVGCFLGSLVAGRHQRPLWPEAWRSPWRHWCSPSLPS